ncbi:MAG: prepilin-type N-terminal cleavage/methylation domain-containing protein, partial [Candidatus Omnitrophica bacterium]|nr:prepilin-type N-terminal cleavage/methylation domain-containing protein [Candidatus Omnitrophota bacterium]
MPRNESGLTLIELLVTTAILSVISLAIYSSLNSGIKVWQRITREIPHEELDIFFNKFARDLHNAIRFTGISFLGTDEMLEFATLVNSPLGGAGSTPGRVRYVYDPGSHKLTRSQQDYSQVYTGEEAAKEQPIAGDVTSLKF